MPTSPWSFMSLEVSILLQKGPWEARAGMEGSGVSDLAPLVSTQPQPGQHQQLIDFITPVSPQKPTQRSSTAAFGIRCSMLG